MARRQGPQSPRQHLALAAAAALTRAQSPGKHLAVNAGTLMSNRAFKSFDESSTTAATPGTLKIMSIARRDWARARKSIILRIGNALHRQDPL
jgi:hypothetical protein